jgi:hypothetical protein
MMKTKPYKMQNKLNNVSAKHNTHNTLNPKLKKMKKLFCNSEKILMQLWITLMSCIIKPKQHKTCWWWKLKEHLNATTNDGNDKNIWE